MAGILVGIDIGTRYVKVAVFEQKAKPLLTNAFCFPVPFDASSDSHKQVNTGALLKKITDSIPLKTLRSAKVSVNLPHPAITALSVLLPVMSKKELSFAAINEAKQKMIPPSVAEHIFECLLLGEKAVNKVAKSEVLVIRTENMYVQKILELFKTVDITPALIAPACTVTPSAIPKETWAKDENVVFVDVGASSLDISICRQQKLEFVRNIVYGFNDIVVDIARQLGANEEKTEQAIREQGVPEVPFDMKNKVAIAEEIMRQKYEESLNAVSAAESGVNALELRMLWQPHLERIVQEIRRSLIFYREQSEGRRIEQVYFLGGVSQIKNFITALSAQIGGHCQVLLPFKEIETSKEVQFKDELIETPIFTNAATLALGILRLKDADQAAVNFLPIELRRKEIVKRRRLLVVLAGLALIGVFGAASLQLFLSNMLINKKIKGVEFESRRLKRVGAKLKELQDKDNSIEQRSSQIEQKAKEKHDPSKLIADLKKFVPAEVVFSNLALSQNKMTLKAFVFADYEQANDIIEDFKHTVESLPYLKNVTLLPLKLEEISPQLSSEEGEVVLTQAKIRTFTLTAEITGN